MSRTFAFAAVAAGVLLGTAIAPAHAFKGCCDWGEPNGTSLTGTIVAAPTGQIETITFVAL